MKKLIFLTFLTFLLSSCKKEKLTKLTQNGANTFSCKINGKVYVAKSDLFSPKFYGGFYGSGNNTGKLSLSANTDPFQISIEVPYIDRLGIYKLNGTNYCQVNPLPIVINGKTYSTKASDIGEVTIVFIDSEKRILSGNFSFTAINTNDLSDRLEVSDGRFDIQTK